MQIPRLLFTSQVSRIVCDGSADALSKVRELAKSRRSEHLNLTFSQSTETNLVLQSLTGSTVVQVQLPHVNLRTNYFDDFKDPSKSAERTRYARDKHAELLSLLMDAGARPLFIGVIITARMAVVDSDGDAHQLARLAARVLGLSDMLTESHTPFDFDIRVSRVIEPDLYVNFYVRWYQERTVTIEIPPGRLGDKIPISNEWEMPVASQGLEFIYDHNNKCGLNAGKREWSTEEFLGIVEGAVGNAPHAFDRVFSALVQAGGGHA